jgi:fatty-acyl-CoA synthase
MLNPGADVAATDLIEFCRGKLASFKIPHHVLFVKEFPMTSSGKVQKFRLRELAMEGLNIEEPTHEHRG